MINYDNFRKLVGSRFWKHIHKETLLPYYAKIIEREQFLKDLYKEIETMSYVPSPPRGYIVSHKQNLVVRFIPSLTEKDYCVYFFCIKCLEDEIAKNRVEGTYGGWRLGGKIRQMEALDDMPSISDYSYNRFAWKKAWKEYQKKAYKLYKNNNNKFFVVFDIANYYDSIRLNRLEILVRANVNKNKTQIVNLLFYFLENWGKRDLNYEKQNIGLPQDEVGDCSRILANYYLQEYDSNLFLLCSKHKSHYLRYADDQIIAAPSEKAVKALMFVASMELIKLGLNLNASKAKFFTRQEYYIYWSFDIFDLLTDENDKQKIQIAWIKYKERLDKNILFRPDTVLKRFLSCNLFKVDKLTRVEILSESNKKEFITSVNEYYLKQIYRFTELKNGKNYICLLNKLSDEVLYNQYHLRVLKFAKENKINFKSFTKVINNLERLKNISK